MWFKLFGRQLPLREDPPGEIDEKVALLEPDVVEQLTKEEKQQRDQENKAVHLVSNISTSPASLRTDTFGFLFCLLPGSLQLVPCTHEPMRKG